MIVVEQGQRLAQILKNHHYDMSSALEDNALAQLFFQSRAVPIERAQRDIVAFKELCDQKILIRENGQVYATLRVVPYQERLFIVDSPILASTQGADQYYSNKDGFYGFIGADGMMLLNHMIPRLAPVASGKGLDLCTGSGIIGISVAPVFEKMYGVDIEECAANWACFNARLNHCSNFEVFQGDLYAPVGEKGPFDLIAANPSFSFFPQPIMEQFRIKAHEVAQDYGLDLVLRIIDGFARHLAPDGKAFICTLAPILNGKDYLVQRIGRLFSHRPYAFEIRYNHQYMHPICRQYYADIGISRLYFVFISIQKGRPYSLKKSVSPLYYLSRLPISKRLLKPLRQWAKKLLFLPPAR
jgi:methylase of polypeptide subunit release factors